MAGGKRKSWRPMLRRPLELQSAKAGLGRGRDGLASAGELTADVKQRVADGYYVADGVRSCEVPRPRRAAGRVGRGLTGGFGGVRVPAGR